MTATDNRKATEASKRCQMNAQFIVSYQTIETWRENAERVNPLRSKTQFEAFLLSLYPRQRFER